jgi:hypothetical protein
MDQQAAKWPRASKFPLKFAKHPLLDVLPNILRAKCDDARIAVLACAPPSAALG